MIETLVGWSKALAALSKRELRVFIALGLGYLLMKNSADIAAFAHQPEVAPILFSLAIFAIVLGGVRVVMRVMFPWMDLRAAWTEALTGSLPAALVFLAGVALLGLGAWPLASMALR